MENKTKELKRLARAQANYRDRQRLSGSVRLDLYISKMAYEQLVSTCAIEGCSQSVYLDRLLSKETPPQKEEKYSMGSSLSDFKLQAEALSRQELINLIERQQYWLERYQKLNDALMAK